MTCSFHVICFLLQAQVLHWKCLSKVKHIYGTQLWTVMQQTLDVIVAGIKVNLPLRIICIQCVSKVRMYSYIAMS